MPDEGQEQEAVLDPNVAHLDEPEELEEEVEEAEGEEEGEDSEDSEIEQLRQQLRQSEAKAHRLGAKAERLKNIESRLDAVAPLLERLRQQQEPQEPEEAGPDPEEDPIAAAAFQAKKTREELQALRNDYAQQLAATGQREQIHNLVSIAEASAAAFQEDHPDYADAANHYVDHMARTFKALGTTEKEMPARLEQLQIAVILQAREAEMDPATYLYEQAKELGYEPAPAAPATNGDQPASAKPTADAKAKKIAQSESLGAVGGGAAPDSGSSAKEWFTKLSDLEFDKFFDQALKKTGLDADTLDRMIEEDKISLRQLGIS